MSPSLHASLRARHALVATSLLLAACSDGEGTAPGAGRASVSLSVAASGASVATAAIAAQVNDPTSVVLTDGTADTLVLTRVQLVFDEIEFERSRGDECDRRDATNDDRGGDDDDVRCPSLQVGPHLVDVPLGAAPAVQVGFTIPAGRYDEFEFELDGVSGTTQRERDFLAANPGFRDVSIRAEGRWRGQPFTWTSRLEHEAEFEFEPDLEITAGVNDNVTLDLDLGAWFRSAQGRLIAPVAANQALLEANVLRALSAFGDRDRDGDDDRGRGRGRGRGQGRGGSDGA